MAEIVQLLAAIESGEARAAEELLPLVYDELRKLAAAKVANEPPGQTLQATALVHEAWIRLGKGLNRKLDNRFEYRFSSGCIERPISSRRTGMLSPWNCAGSGRIG